MVDPINKSGACLTIATIKQCVAHEEWFHLEVEKCVKAADKGRLLDHFDIKGKWEARLAAQ